MRSHEQEQAAVSVIVPKGGSRGNDATQVGGLSSESILSASACAIVRCRAMLCLPSRLTGGRLGGLRYLRRLFATSRSARGFSFGVHRNHGLIAPVHLYGVMPCGKPSGLSLPKERSANPRGVSHLLGGWWVTSYSLSLGIFAMMRTLSRNVSTVFPSSPEPLFLPVESLHKRSADSQKADTLTDVVDAVDALLDRCVDALHAANRAKNAALRDSLKAACLSYVEDLADICRPVDNSVVEVRHG